MASVHLTRRVTFHAEHRYHRTDWSAADNERAFGHADAPYHAHQYTCAVSVSGQMDSRTGMVVDLGALDAVLAREVVARFDGKRINDDVPEFRNGNLVPTGETLARFVYERVSAGLPSGANVTEVTVAEDPTLSATYRGD